MTTDYASLQVSRGKLGYGAPDVRQEEDAAKEYVPKAGMPGWGIEQLVTSSDAAQGYVPGALGKQGGGKAEGVVNRCRLIGDVTKRHSVSNFIKRHSIGYVIQ